MHVSTNGLASNPLVSASKLAQPPSLPGAALSPDEAAAPGSFTATIGQVLRTPADAAAKAQRQQGSSSLGTAPVEPPAVPPTAVGLVASAWAPPAQAASTSVQIPVGSSPPAKPAAATRQPVAQTAAADPVGKNLPIDLATVAAAASAGPAVAVLSQASLGHLADPQAEGLRSTDEPAMPATAPTPAGSPTPAGNVATALPMQGGSLARAADLMAAGDPALTVPMAQSSLGQTRDPSAEGPSPTRTPAMSAAASTPAGSPSLARTVLTAASMPDTAPVVTADLMAAADPAPTIPMAQSHPSQTRDPSAEGPSPTKKPDTSAAAQVSLGKTGQVGTVGTAAPSEDNAPVAAVALTAALDPAPTVSPPQQSPGQVAIPFTGNTRAADETVSAASAHGVLGPPDAAGNAAAAVPPAAATPLVSPAIPQSSQTVPVAEGAADGAATLTAGPPADRASTAGVTSSRAPRAVTGQPDDHGRRAAGREWQQQARRYDRGSRPHSGWCGSAARRDRARSPYRGCGSCRSRPASRQGIGERRAACWNGRHGRRPGRCRRERACYAGPTHGSNFAAGRIGGAAIFRHSRQAQAACREPTRPLRRRRPGRRARGRQ